MVLNAIWELVAKQGAPASGTALQGLWLTPRGKYAEAERASEVGAQCVPQGQGDGMALQGTHCTSQASTLLQPELHVLEVRGHW